MASRKIEIVDKACAIGIIYRASDPRQIFMEIKDEGYPRKAFRGMGCLIGGNWVGKSAKNDFSPIDTFLRELREGLSFDRAESDLTEFRQLHGLGGKSIAVDVDSFYALAKRVEPTGLDVEILDKIKGAIAEQALPYSAHLVSVPETIFRKAEPDYRGDKKALLCCFVVGLSDGAWALLCALQGKFGNLSNESISLITSLEEIIASNLHISWGHDRVLKQFFREQCGDAAVENFPMVPHIRTVYKGLPRHSYDYYLERYALRLTPFGPSRVPGV